MVDVLGVITISVLVTGVDLCQDMDRNKMTGAPSPGYIGNPRSSLIGARWVATL